MKIFSINHSSIDRALNPALGNHIYRGWTIVTVCELQLNKIVIKFKKIVVADSFRY